MLKSKDVAQIIDFVLVLLKGQDRIIDGNGRRRAAQRGVGGVAIISAKEGPREVTSQQRPRIRRRKASWSIGGSIA
nr:hypothetical protein [Cressdnaviricota sp.]UOF82579.1 hypothetical protein [Cressdnaviricota sp.]